MLGGDNCYEPITDGRADAGWLAPANQHICCTPPCITFPILPGASVLSFQNVCQDLLFSGTSSAFF